MSARMPKGIAFLLILSAAIGAAPNVVAATMTLASNGKTSYVICLRANATAEERDAGDELQQFLRKITGADFPIVTLGAAPRYAIVIGTSALTNGRTSDDFAITTSGERIVIDGASPRGAINGVYRFLNTLGCRWWTADAEFIPTSPTLTVPTLNIHESPAFTWRLVNVPSAADSKWSMRNLLNAARYAGFVHTFFWFVPPKQYFKAHPEWYSLISGKRRSGPPYATQLCLSNGPLRAFMAERVKAALRAEPDAQIVSVSQNDWGGFCQCDRCQFLYRKYGSTSGALLEFVNAVAALVEPEFPHVIIDTLAYASTAKPPTGIRARENVAVRFCTKDADPYASLDSQANQRVAAEIDAWRAIVRHLHVWYYTANFGEYYLPHPNWFTVGMDLQRLRSRDVESVFLQAVATPAGGELGELRSWVFAQQLWNPSRDAHEVVSEFVEGYYGRGPARPILSYLDLMSAAASPSQPRDQFLTFSVLADAERLWNEAERAAGGTESLRRVRRSHLSVRYAWLVRWVRLQREARATGSPWPLPASRAEVARDWYAAMTNSGAKLRNEPLEEFPGLTAEAFAQRIAIEPLSKTDDHETATQRLVPVVPMPGGFLCLAAAVVAIGLAIRAGVRAVKSDRVILVLALAAIATAALILALRGSFLMWRYAVLSLTISGVAVALSAVYCIRGALRLSSTARALTTLLVVGATLYCFWWSLPYGRIRANRGRPLSVPRARLAYSNLSGVMLHGASLPDSDLRGAYIANAILNRAILDGADLRRADLTGTQMVYASCRDADLRGTDLRGAMIHDITHTAFRGALYDASTRFPPGFEPLDWDMSFVGSAR